MTRRLFVCHATADIEATSELVDALENALSFSAGSLWTSGLPGYSAEPNDLPALGAALAGSDLVLALVTHSSVHDAQFHFQLGAAWALGAHTVLFLLEPIADEALPNVLNQATVMRGHEPSQWSELIGDLSVRLGLVPRPGASYAPAISPSSPPPAPKSAPPPPAAVPSAPRVPPELIAAAAASSTSAQTEPATGPRLQANATAPSAPSTHAELTTAAAPADSMPAATSASAGLSATDAAAPSAQAEDAAHASSAPASATTDDAPITPAQRADDTPLPAALAKIANASARPPGATTALHAASAQINAAKAQSQQPTAAAPAKTISVPPLPGAPPARTTHVPPLPTAAPARKVGVPPLPAAVSTSSLIVPPPPAGAHPDFDDSAEPTTTPKAQIIILTSLPEHEHEIEIEPSVPAKADAKPQPRAAGAYPSVAPQQSYLDELRAIDPAERTPPRYSYVDELETLDTEADAAAASGYEALPSDDDEPDTREQLRIPTRDGVQAVDTDEVDPASDSDVFARLPTCEMALEAGRAVSDCLFNRDEISNFTADLDGPLGGLIESLGASWIELRDEQDLDTWVAVTDHLLQTLPEEVRKLEEWYRVGFELAILHNLAAQLVLDGSDPAAEQHWRGALERFLMRAERAEIGYENLGRVLGLLENLAGPSHERDLTNISRSLEELRRYAAGADIHTAA